VFVHKANTTACLILSLPPEIRNLIYEFAIPRSSPTMKKPLDESVCACFEGQCRYYSHHATQPEPGFLRACKQMRAEARAMYYAHNVFHVHADNMDSTRAAKWLMSVGAANVVNIPLVHFAIHPLCWGAVVLLKPWLEAMRVTRLTRDKVRPHNLHGFKDNTMNLLNDIFDLPQYAIQSNWSAATLEANIDALIRSRVPPNWKHYTPVRPRPQNYPTLGINFDWIED